MPCITEEPEMKWEKQVEMMLEQAFRYLSIEQLLTINGSPNSGWIGACGWYRSHLCSDFLENYHDENAREFYINEAKRLGWNLIKIEGGALIE